MPDTKRPRSAAVCVLSVVAIAAACAPPSDPPTQPGGPIAESDRLVVTEQETVDGPTSFSAIEVAAACPTGFVLTGGAAEPALTSSQLVEHEGTRVDQDGERMEARFRFRRNLTAGERAEMEVSAICLRTG